MPNKNLSAVERLQELAQKPNIADEFTKDKLADAGGQACEEYRIDRQSRSKWETNAREAMETVLQEKKEKNYPFPGASNIQFPLLTTASLQFAARAYPAIISGPNVVRCQIIGADRDDRKKKRAERVSTHMSYQLTKEMPEWEADTDTLLHQLPVLGCAFRKVFYSHEQVRPVSKLISAFDLVVNQGATSLETVPRATHRFELYPHEIEGRIRSKTFLDFNYKSAPDSLEDDLRRHKEISSQDGLSPHTFLEQHRYYDLDGDGLAEPCIFTLHESSEQVVRVAANYDLKRATLGPKNEIIELPRYNFFVKYPFIPDPAGGFYDVGFGTLLRSLTGAINTLLNQAIDATHLQNAGGGFIGAGLNLKKSTFRFEPGVYHVVEAAGAAVRDAVVQLQHGGPSAQLTALLSALIEFGRELTATQEILTGDAGRTQTATTTLAQIEQGLKLFTAAYKRVFRALGQEMKLLYEINGRYPNEKKYLTIVDWQPELSSFPPAAGPMPGAALDLPSAGGPIPPSDSAPGIGAPQGQMPAMPQAPMEQEQAPTMAGDYNYDDCDICPVADPNMVTDMQRMAKAQLLQELAGHPTIGPQMDAGEAGRRILTAANMDEIDKLIPEKQGPSPMDELQLRGAQADVADKEAGAELKKAQTAKTMTEAQSTPQKLEIEKAKAANAGLSDERKFVLDSESLQHQKQTDNKAFAAERADADRGHAAERQDAERAFIAERHDADRDHLSGRIDADRQFQNEHRQFQADQFDKAEESTYREHEMSNAAAQSDRDEQHRDREFQASQEQAERSHAVELEKAKAAANKPKAAKKK